MKKRPVIFGEVLFDSFPDGDVLGGAPFNVAWNLKGAGLDPLLVTAVGDDHQGDQVLKSMTSWGLSTLGVQRVADKPTGKVNITFEKNTHRFDILDDQAYDHIDADIAIDATRQTVPALLYHGTLAARTPVSRQALETLQTTFNLPRFVDVNLREPWFRKDDVRTMARGAEWVKLNDDELRILTHTEVTELNGIERIADEFRVSHDILLLIITMGAKGAFAVSDSGTTWHPAPPMEGFADSVGAGDAFSAMMIAGLLSGHTVSDIMEMAVTFSATVCQQRGAVSTDPNFYRSLSTYFGDKNV